MIRYPRLDLPVRAPQGSLGHDRRPDPPYLHGSLSPLGTARDAPGRLICALFRSAPTSATAEQVGLNSAAQCRYSQHIEPELVILPAAERARAGTVPVSLPKGTGSPSSPAPVEGVGGQVEEDLAREGVVARMRGRCRGDEFTDDRRAELGWPLLAAALPLRRLGSPRLFVM